jgi:hypothetical protein
MTFQELVKLIRENDFFSRSLALMLSGRWRSSDVRPATKDGKGFVYGPGAEEAQRIKAAMEREEEFQKSRKKSMDESKR